MLWLLLEGILRRWFFPSISSTLFFGKYAIVALAYFVFFLHKMYVPRLNRVYQLFLVLYLLWGIMGFFNYRLDNPIVIPISGLIVHFFFFPLLHLSQFYFTSLTIINKFLKWIALISIPIGIFGVMQYYLPADHVFNQFIDTERQTTVVGEFTRVTSIFPFVKIYSEYLFFVILLLVAKIYINILNKKSNLLYTAALIISSLNLLMTASRLPIFLTLFFIIILLIYIFFNFANAQRTVLITVIIGGILATTLYFQSPYIKDSVDAFTGRIEMIKQVNRDEDKLTNASLRLYDRLDIFKFGEQSGLIGFGIGTTYQGVQSLLKNPIPNAYFEEEGERLVLELGIVGVCLIILFRFFMLMYALMFAFRCKNQTIKILTFTLSLIILAPVLTLKLTVFNYLDNYIYWLSCGLIIALARIYHQMKSDEDVIN